MNGRSMKNTRKINKINTSIYKFYFLEKTFYDLHVCQFEGTVYCDKNNNMLTIIVYINCISLNTILF